MSFILNIDTSIESAAVCIAENGTELHTISNSTKKDHATFLHNAIKNIIEITSIGLQSLDAIAVANGPGSYTGLRVGLATAKGLCYALNKPLILLNTLEVMAHAAIKETFNTRHSVADILYCPMIDARRMEVFTGIYNEQIENIVKPDR